HAGEAEIPLGVRDSAMSVETSRRALPSALWRARLCRHAQRLDLSGAVSAGLAGDGFDFDLHTCFEQPRSFAATGGLFVYQPAASSLLLRPVSRRRLVRGGLCLRARA